MRISDWSSDVCSSDLIVDDADEPGVEHGYRPVQNLLQRRHRGAPRLGRLGAQALDLVVLAGGQRHGSSTFGRPPSTTRRPPHARCFPFNGPATRLYWTLSGSTRLWR